MEDWTRLPGMHDPGRSTARLDPATLPPPILTSEAGSFAQDTLKVRMPAILRRRSTNPDFDHLMSEWLWRSSTPSCVGGTIRGLCEDAPDVAFWNEVSAPHLGGRGSMCRGIGPKRTSTAVLLEATGYFRLGRGQGLDPFSPKKRTEWMPEAAPRAVDALLAGLPDDETDCFEQLFHASLWGNRTDLSYMVAAHLGGTANAHAERENLLVDDTAEVWRFLASRRPLRAWSSSPTTPGRSC